MTIRRFLSFALIVLTVFASAETTADDEDAVVLAKCPEDETGYYYNNGRSCIREKQTWNRRSVPATCPEEGHWKLRGGWCRRRFHRKVKPTCPPDHQLYRRNNGGAPECQSPCPPGTRASRGRCVLPRAVLAPSYMTCPVDDGDDDDDTTHSHRHGAYCCSMEAGNCPRAECRIGGDGVPPPGRFYYNADTGVCERQVQVLHRPTTTPSPLPVPAAAADDGPRRPRCPDDKVYFRRKCQAPCPPGYRTSRGKCILPYCSFDTAKDSMVTCPEGTYSLPREPL